MKESEVNRETGDTRGAGLGLSPTDREESKVKKAVEKHEAFVGGVALYRSLKENAKLTDSEVSEIAQGAVYTFLSYLVEEREKHEAFLKRFALISILDEGGEADELAIGRHCERGWKTLNEDFPLWKLNKRLKEIEVADSLLNFSTEKKLKEDGEESLTDEEAWKLKEWI